MSSDVPNRRRLPRLDAFDQHRIVSTSVQPGHAARVIDVCAGGTLIETNHRLLPGTSVELQVDTKTDRASVRGRVLRCSVVRVRPTWVCYRGAIAFDEQLPWFVAERGELSTLPLL